MSAVGSGGAPEGEQAAVGESADSRRRAFWKALFALFVMFLAVYTLYNWASVLQSLERTARDFQARARGPWGSTDVVIVRITDADYHRLFEGRSPLDADSLRRLISAAASGRPAAIAVDLATSDSTFRDLADEEEWPPIVWAREAVECEWLPVRTRSCAAGERVLLAFAGSGDPDALAGLVSIGRDPDGVIRRYRRWIPMGDTLHPSFSTAVRIAMDDRVGAADTAVTYFIHYRPWPGGMVLDASTVMDMAESPDFGEMGVLRDRIVFLGGDYRAARDRYATPLGERSGVEILAQVYQTEVTGRATEPLRADVIGILLFVNGLALLVMFLLLDFPRAFLLSLLSIPVFATASSLIVDGTPFAVWPYVLPLLIAVLIQQLYAHAMRYRNRLIREAAGRRGKAGVPDSGG